MKDKKKFKKKKYCSQSKLTIQEKKMNVDNVPEDLTILDGATTSVQSIGGWYAQILARRRRQRSTVNIQKWWRRRTCITNPESPTKILNKI